MPNESGVWNKHGGKKFHQSLKRGKWKKGGGGGGGVENFLNLIAGVGWRKEAEEF